VVSNLPPATLRSREFDGEEPVVGFFEVGSDGVDFVDQIFDAGKAQVAETFFDGGVVGKLDALTVDVTGTSFVDHLGDGFLGRITPCDEWVGDTEHLFGSFVESDKDGVTDLPEPQKLEDFLGFGGDLVDTSDPGDNGESWRVGNEKVTRLFGGPGVVDQSSFFGGVFGGVLSGFGDVFSPFHDSVLFGFDASLGVLGGELGVAGPLFG